MTIRIDTQIREVEREIAMRQQVYARRVGKGDMRQAEADLLIQRMQAVLRTLRFCEEHEADFRAYVTAKKAGAA